MKKAKIILWILFPVFLAFLIVSSYFRIITSMMLGNILTMITFLLPITAMLLQTLENKDNNSSKNYFIIKISFVIYLYLMIIFMFVFTLLGIYK